MDGERVQGGNETLSAAIEQHDDRRQNKETFLRVYRDLFVFRHNNYKLLRYTYTNNSV